jgi:hypothetical protein
VLDGVFASAPAGAAAAASVLRSPPFALERLRQHDAEHLIYATNIACLSASGAQILTPLQLIGHLAALASPPRPFLRCAGSERTAPPRSDGHGAAPRATIEGLLSRIRTTASDGPSRRQWAARVHEALREPMTNPIHSVGMKIPTRLNSCSISLP